MDYRLTGHTAAVCEMRGRHRRPEETAGGHGVASLRQRRRAGTIPGRGSSWCVSCASLQRLLRSYCTVLTLRILYRLRFLAERKPVDSAFYAFTSPLLSRVIGSNGVGLASDEAEGKLEQLTLVVEFIAAHARAGTLRLASTSMICPD